MEHHEQVRQAGLPWAEALGRFIGTSAAELAHWVTPADPGDLVTSISTCSPENVLVGRDGQVLLDWDNAGCTSAEREFARAVYVWSGGNHVDIDSARRLARAYRSAGGRAALTGPQSFSMLFATALNFVYVGQCAIDQTVTAAQREFADPAGRRLLARHAGPGGRCPGWQLRSMPRGNRACPSVRSRRNPYATALAVGEERRQFPPLFGDGGALGRREAAQWRDVHGACLDVPGRGDPAVDEDDAGARDRQPAVGVVDDPAAVVVAEERVVERRQEPDRGGRVGVGARRCRGGPAVPGLARRGR